MTACSCKLVLPACWPHAGMQLRAACVVFLPCLWFLGMFSACWWHVKTCFICHVYSRPRLALACLWRLARASLSYRHVGLTRVCSYVLPASSSCHVCGFSACLVRVGDMSRHVLYVMFTQDLDLRWHVYDGLLVQACLTGMLASRGYAVTCCLRRLPAMFVVSRHV